MARASLRHNHIAVNVCSALHQRVGVRCRVLTSDQRVVTGDELYTYPDGLVACGKLDVMMVLGTGTVRNPSLLYEILSPSTRDHDLGEKLTRYKTIASLKEVLLIEQDVVDVVHVRRTATGWEEERYTSLADVVPLLTLRRGLPVKDVYARAFEI